MKPLLLLSLMTLLLAGCQASVMLRSDDSSAYRVNAVRLLQPLTVYPDTTRTFLQDGEVLAKGGQGDQYRARCAFELRALSSSYRTIEPANFEVSRVQHVIDEVVLSKPLQLAGLNLTAIDGGGGAPLVHAGYHFWFEAEPAGVMRMSCYGVFEVIQQVEPPTLEDIRRTLAGVAEISVTRSP